MNNPDNLEPCIQSEVKRRLSVAKYWVIGSEIAPSTGTPHWQGFIWTHHPVRFNTVHQMLEGTRAHITRCDDKAYQIMVYCKKDGKFEEWGQPPKDQTAQGSEGREASLARWRAIDALAKAGDWDRLREEYPAEWIRCHKTLKNIRLEGFHVREPLRGPLVNEWLVGDSGCGKSWTARHENPGCFVKDVDHDAEKWWDTYNGEEVVVIEDVSPFNKKFTDSLKKWTDRYPFPAQVKGGYMTIRPKKIVVTSQYRIEEIWEDRQTRDALNRRFITREINDPEGWKREEKREEGDEVVDLDQEI